MSLALPESRKRVEFWTKGTMHACCGIVFGGITGKGKERKLVGKRKSWYQGNGERLIKMTTLKKMRGLFLNFVGVRGAAEGGFKRHITSEGISQEREKRHGALSSRVTCGI